MKAQNIKDHEIENHCFGLSIRINGYDIEHIPKDELIEFVVDMLENDINAYNLRREVVSLMLENLQYPEKMHHSHGDCDQCGVHHYIQRFEKR
jgi:hypothetical protein